MLSLLFWNIAKQSTAYRHVSNLIEAHSPDVFLLAECPGDLDALLSEVNSTSRVAYRLSERDRGKIRALTRIDETHFSPSYLNRRKDLSIWSITSGSSKFGRVLLAGIHLPAKVGLGDVDQTEVACEVAQEICLFEAEEKCYDTIILGDFNMNPYDPGMVQVSAFHSSMTRDIAARERTYRKRDYRRFYNPMWGLFGDRSEGPAGSYYWDSSTSSNHFWHIYDQILLRPGLMERVRRVAILDSDGKGTLVDPNNIPTKIHLSDHLPILCQMDF